MKFKLLNIRLRKSYFLLNDDVISKVGGEGEFEIKKEMHVALARDSKDNNFVQVGLQIQNNDTESPFNFDIIYDGFFRFESSDEISNEEIEKAGLINCAAIIFPYVREHLADLTRRSGLPPFHLPPVNFLKLYEQRNRSGTDGR